MTLDHHATGRAMADDVEHLNHAERVCNIAAGRHAGLHQGAVLDRWHGRRTAALWLIAAAMVALATALAVLVTP
ncbi:hypothetical protein ACFSDD_11225 [Salipiger marinus]|uniref:hypothetical protein n=1 Tax=Salipiger marinus TaxID=555512 RepID=UPI002C245566|nr:hypothetical protein [Salipiger manganoxidans]MEB3419943.1 hypothetical protein [Salipiger manganoxidans]